MNKLAMFVEGYTEVQFCTQLIQLIASESGLKIECRKIRGGTTVRLSYRLIEEFSDVDNNEVTHFVLIYDCGNDSLVKSRMVAEYQNLADAKYSSIICLRDVYPDIAFADIAKLENGLPFRVRTQPIPVKFILSVMEVEAWFLAEYSHFKKIDPTITLERIRNLGIDVENGDLRQRGKPTEDLRDCYALAGKSYEKLNTAPTMQALDMMKVYFEVSQRLPYLQLLCEEITSFFKEDLN